MKKRFSHIIRISIVSFLMAGILAHLIIPFTSHAQKTAFSQWLNQNVVASGEESENELRDAIRRLTEQTADFRVLVQEASQLVASHKEDFRLNSAVPATTNDQVTSWLVGQWNVFQHQQTGTDAILPDGSMPLHKWLNTNPFSKTFRAAAQIYTDSVRKADSHFFYSVASNLIIPLASGISINAP